MRASWLWLMAACRTSPVEAPVEEPTKNVFLPSDEAPAAAGQPSETPEPMGLVYESGAVRVTIVVGVEETHHDVPVELAALRLADIATLQYPIGYLKLDVGRWASVEHPEWSRAIVDSWLRDEVGPKGTPIQAFVDISTIGQPTGRVAVGGPPVEADVLGSIQLDDRQQEIDLPVRFTRPDEDHLVMELTRPVRVNLSGFARQDHTAALEAALGGALGPEVRLEGKLVFKQFEGVELPNFVRTPVTVATVSEVRERLEKSVDHYDMAQQRAEASGIDASLQQKVSRESLDKMKQGLREISAEKGSRPLPPR
jgi:hypothetical protein